MILDLLSRLPHFAVNPEAGVIISALIVSLAVAVLALIRNRRALTVPVDQGGDLGTIFEDPASLMPHLLELRTRLVNSLFAILVTTVIAALLTDRVLRLLAAPAGGLAFLQVIRVTEGIHVYFQIAITVGIILASPYIISQLWIFVAAGLKPAERRWFYLLFPFAIALFLCGVAFAYIVMLPVAVPFLTHFVGIAAIPTLDDYVNFVTTILLWVGITFEMPLVVFLLAKAHIVSAGMLARHWRIAVVVITIASAVITPTPDPINMGIVAAPMLVLYLLSVILALFAR
jgi:sec-independent protein translocase protein TatC